MRLPIFVGRALAPALGDAIHRGVELALLLLGFCFSASAFASGFAATGCEIAGGSAVPAARCGVVAASAGAGAVAVTFAVRGVDCGSGRGASAAYTSAASANEATHANAIRGVIVVIAPREDGALGAAGSGVP